MTRPTFARFAWIVIATLLLCATIGGGQAVAKYAHIPQSLPKSAERDAR